MDAIKSANLALRFLLELVALAAVGYWGFRTGVTPFGKLALGLGAPVAVIAVWAVFVAPNSAVTVTRSIKAALGLVILELAALALALAGQQLVAVIFGVIVLINAVLIVLWEQ